MASTAVSNAYRLSTDGQLIEHGLLHVRGCGDVNCDIASSSCRKMQHIGGAGRSSGHGRHRTPSMTIVGDGEAVGTGPERDHRTWGWWKVGCRCRWPYLAPSQGRGAHCLSATA